MSLLHTGAAPCAGGIAAFVILREGKDLRCLQGWGRRMQILRSLTLPQDDPGGEDGSPSFVILSEAKDLRMPTLPQDDAGGEDGTGVEGSPAGDPDRPRS